MPKAKPQKIAPKAKTAGNEAFLTIAAPSKWCQRYRIPLRLYNKLAIEVLYKKPHTHQGWSGGNFNFDSVVNLLDFNLLAANFGLSV